MGQSGACIMCIASFDIGMYVSRIRWHGMGQHKDVATQTTASIPTIVDRLRYEVCRVPIWFRVLPSLCSSRFSIHASLPHLLPQVVIICRNCSCVLSTSQLIVVRDLLDVESIPRNVVRLQHLEAALAALLEQHGSVETDYMPDQPDHNTATNRVVSLSPQHITPRSKKRMSHIRMSAAHQHDILSTCTHPVALSD
jgi:hypothetical protein